MRNLKGIMKRFLNFFFFFTICTVETPALQTITYLAAFHHLRAFSAIKTWFRFHYARSPQPCSWRHVSRHHRLRHSGSLGCHRKTSPAPALLPYRGTTQVPNIHLVSGSRITIRENENNLYINVSKRLKVTPMNSAYGSLWCRTVVSEAQESQDFKLAFLSAD